MADKIRYAKGADESERCSVAGCRIRGRYRYEDGTRICYGHLSKRAVDRMIEDGLVEDAPQEAYVNTKRKPGQKRRYGND